MALLSLSAYAKHAGISPAMVTKLVKQGVLAGALKTKKGRKKPLIDSEKADKFRAARQQPQQIKLTNKKKPKPDTPPPEASPSDESGTATYIQARTWSERYRAAERKLNFEIKQGLWLQKQSVKEECFKAGRLCRDALLNVPDRVSAIVAAESDEAKVKEILQKEIETAIKDYIRMLNAISR